MASVHFLLHLTKENSDAFRKITSRCPLLVRESMCGATSASLNSLKLVGLATCKRLEFCLTATHDRKNTCEEWSLHTTPQFEKIPISPCLVRCPSRTHSSAQLTGLQWTRLTTSTWKNPNAPPAPNADFCMSIQSSLHGLPRIETSFFYNIGFPCGPVHRLPLHQPPSVAHPLLFHG